MPSDPTSRRATRKTASRPGRPAAKVSKGVLRVGDPRDIKALAHPARMAIIDALATGDELTATECAELTGLSPSATAYHLKLLERYDFAERAPARDDGRERPWRASSRGTLVDLEPTTPAGAAAAAALALTLIDRTRALAAEFIASEHEEPAEWQDVASLGNADLWLRPEEAQQLTEAFSALLKPYRARVLADAPPGSRRVRVTTMVTPYPRPAT